jgi:hypothetical protein
LKYVYNIETQNLSEISYYNRFKSDSPLLYNIKAGLGIIKHYEVSRVNGIPAFASLFIPITGFRSFFLSILMLFLILYGLFLKLSNPAIKFIILSITLTMIGFVLSGTGFSRYWLVLLPAFFLGFSLLGLKFGIKKYILIPLMIGVSFIYVLNEVRLDVLVLNRLF